MATYAFRTHRLHGDIQTSVDLHHVARDLAHSNCCLYTASDGIDAGGELQEVELLVLFADGVSGVDACDIVVALLHSLASASVCCWLGARLVVRAHLFQLGLLGLLFLAGFEGLPVQRLGCELVKVSRLTTSRDRRPMPTLRLKSAFSRPDMVCSWRVTVRREGVGWSRA